MKLRHWLAYPAVPLSIIGIIWVLLDSRAVDKRTLVVIVLMTSVGVSDLALAGISAMRGEWTRLLASRWISAAGALSAAYALVAGFQPIVFAAGCFLVGLGVMIRVASRNTTTHIGA